ncbi:type IV pilus modification protein PilV [Marinobacter sp. ATCH36]|uniref:type IV pilus modification protein PilV n=1 Tax=Marinobacter sp. ATCH36 TaxID=2945106 RepID=UPI00202142B2|nr:type IV pilus modification protein PilV [Marinobacter sp. ATCH36]MCL7945878.1 type IV pilus modification protein PilV [Marinobacter sp. ATCH36]
MRKTQRGITMIEVLVALLVLAVGLLGVAGMQTVSMQQTQGADRRSVATLHVQTMADEIRANRGMPTTGVKTEWQKAVKGDLGEEATAEITSTVADKEAQISLSWTARKTQWDDTSQGDDSADGDLLNNNKFEVTVRYAR